MLWLVLVLTSNVADDDGGWAARAPPRPDQRVLAPAQCGHTQPEIHGALPHPGQNIILPSYQYQLYF